MTLARSVLMQKHFEHSKKSVENLFDMMINPVKERVSSKFKRRMKAFSRYNLTASYCLVFKDKEREVHKEDMNFGYLRALRVYQFLINPHNFSKLLEIRKDLISIYSKQKALRI
jgi:hypothetical protein